MPFSVVVNHLPMYLTIEATGDAGLRDLLALVDFGSSLNAATPSRRALVSATGVQGRLTFAEQIRLSSHLVRRLASYQRVAIVVPPKGRYRTIENAAQQLGLKQLRFFRDWHAAQQWIQEPLAPVSEWGGEQGL